MIRKLLATVSALALAFAPISPALAQSIQRAANPLPVPCYPQATDASVRACLSKASASGQAMVVYMPASPVTLTSSLPLLSNVTIQCVTPKLQDITGGSSLVDEWSFVGGAGNGTIFIGGGPNSFAAFSAKKTVLGAWDNSYVTSPQILNCGFSNVTRAWDAGNTYAGGVAYGVFVNNYINNAQDGFFIANGFHTTIYNVQVLNVSSSCGQIVADIPNGVFEPGNQKFALWFCGPRSSMLHTRGWVFQATSGSLMGTINSDFLQVDAAGTTTPYTESNITITSGSSSIPVTHTENFDPGSIVVNSGSTVGTGGSAITSGLYYAVLSRSTSSGPGNLTVAARRNTPSAPSTAITPNASGTISLTNGGFPLLDVAGGQLIASHFTGLDLESHNVNQPLIYAENAGGNTFQVNSMVQAGEAIVFRNSLNAIVDVVSGNATLDADNFVHWRGTLNSALQKYPYGVFSNAARATNCLGLDSFGCSLEEGSPGGVPYVYPNDPLGTHVGFTNSASFTLTASQCGESINFTGSAATWTLPTVSDRTVPGTSNLGCVYTILNLNTNPANTLTINTNTGQTFNNTGGATSYILPAQGIVRLGGISATNWTAAALPSLTTAFLSYGAQFGPLGSTPLTQSAGELGLNKITASGTAPGAGGAKLSAVCGTNAGTLKIIAYAGTSTTPVTIADNIGSGATGC